MLLEITQLKKIYREPDGTLLPILDIARFAVDEAEQVAMVGRSGCGKTTLLHIIAGIRSPTSGRVVLDGVDIARLSEQARDRFRAEKIGYVFQTFNLLPAFTALENVLLGMTFARGKRDVRRARALLERVGVAHRANHKPHALSVGEQQRVAVARALANRPRLLLADEPTANVDPANQERILELICQTCAEERIALILVTHAQEVASRFPRLVRLEEINQVQAVPVAGPSAADSDGKPAAASGDPSRPHVPERGPSDHSAGC
ncbi:MAG: ABC transporter ATP-binding protein [Pirellulaceae bacterium]|nr:MAG: ABC transporter ATP-binding protein [Pirellulaceae bacterium]